MGWHPWLYLVNYLLVILVTNLNLTTKHWLSKKTTMEWLTLYLVHHCLLFLWIESHHPNIKHRTCMVPMECGNSLHPPWFLRGCFILGGWDYLVNMLYNSSWFMFGKVLSMCYALIFGMFMYTVYIFLHCWPFTAGKL